MNEILKATVEIPVWFILYIIFVVAIYAFNDMNVLMKDIDKQIDKKIKKL